MNSSTSTDYRLPTALRTDIRTGRCPDTITAAERKSPLRTDSSHRPPTRYHNGCRAQIAAPHPDPPRPHPARPALPRGRAPRRVVQRRRAVDGGPGCRPDRLGGSTFTITAAVTGSASLDDADLVVDWSIPPIDQGGLAGTVGARCWPAYRGSQRRHRLDADLDRKRRRPADGGPMWLLTSMSR